RRGGRFLCALVQPFAIVVFVNCTWTERKNIDHVAYLSVTLPHSRTHCHTGLKDGDSLVPVVSIMSHFFLVIRQYIRH
ncbi:calcium/calmodulin-dependent protein kinase II inhibitor 2-like, partial [Triplophysa rosa]